jgi:tetratricopeptide (TPR) repeat protein
MSLILVAVLGFVLLVAVLGIRGGGAQTASRAQVRRSDAGLQKLVDKYGKRLQPLVSRADEATFKELNYERSLDLCYRAIATLDDAPRDRAFINELDLMSEIGMAFHLATLALLELRRPEAEFQQLCEKASVWVPLDIPRLREMYTGATEEIRKEDRAAAETARFLGLIGPLTNPAAIEPQERRRIVTEALKDPWRDEQWWKLREAADALARNGDFDLAWAILNCALAARGRGAGSDSAIYAALGGICKKQGRYHDAARMYLLACTISGGQPAKADSEQLRICLKKAGLGEQAPQVRDELLSLASTVGRKEALAALDQHLGGKGPAPVE